MSDDYFTGLIDRYLAAKLVAQDQYDLNLIDARKALNFEFERMSAVADIMSQVKVLMNQRSDVL